MQDQERVNRVFQALPTLALAPAPALVLGGAPTVSFPDADFTDLQAAVETVFPRVRHCCRQNQKDLMQHSKIPRKKLLELPQMDLFLLLALPLPLCPFFSNALRAPLFLLLSRSPNLPLFA